MEISLDALVIGETKLNDNKKYITLLSPERGKLSALVHGASSAKSRSLSAVKPLSYSSFVLTQKGSGASGVSGAYTLREASLKRTFFEVSERPEALALASYIISVAGYVATEGEEQSELFSLTLNSLHKLCSPEVPLSIVKAAFELRTAALIGFAPALVACSVCHDELRDDDASFRIYDGTLRCAACEKRSHELPEYEVVMKLSPAVLAAMRYVIYCDAKKLFSFSLADKKDMQKLNEVCEKYLSAHIEATFPALKIYKELTAKI